MTNREMEAEIKRFCQYDLTDLAGSGTEICIGNIKIDLDIDDTYERIKPAANILKQNNIETETFLYFLK